MGKASASLRETWVRSLGREGRKGQPTPVLLPGKSHGLRSLVGYSQWGHKELDTTERLHFNGEIIIVSGEHNLPSAHISGQIFTAKMVQII